MTKSEKEADLKQRIYQHQSQIDKMNVELTAIKGMREISIKDLFLAYEMREGFEVVKESGPYQYVVGGDGRSGPWSETRTGLVLKVTTPKDLYLSEDDLRTFNRYLAMTEGEDVQAILINGEQQL